MNKIVRLDEKGVVVRCSVWRNSDQPYSEADAVDYAHESIAERGINATSYIENATTPATGRALSLLGGELSPSKKRASRTEMEKAVRNRDWIAEAKSFDTVAGLRSLHAQAKSAGVSADILDAITAIGIALKENSPTGKETKTVGEEA